MGVYHLISVSEDQLRTTDGDQADHERAVGAAVIEACLNPESRAVPGAKGRIDQARPDSTTHPVTVTHVDEHESDEFAMWVWSSGDSVCIADLPDDGLDLVIKLAHAVKMGTIRAPGNIPPGV